MSRARPGGGAGGLANALHAEWTKLRTVQATGWLLATAVLLTVGLSSLAAAIVKCPASCGADTTKISLTGVMLGQALVAVLAVVMMAGEYSTGMIRVTIAAVPRRPVILAAKAIILAAVVLVSGTVAVLGSLLAGRLLLPGDGFTGRHALPALSLWHGPMPRAAAGSVLYLALIALLSLGLATVLRDSGVAIATVLGLVYVVPIIGSLVFDPHWERRFERYAPANAGLAIQATKGLAKLPIGPWQGLGVLAAWAVAALVVGGVLLVVRDA